VAGIILPVYLLITFLLEYCCIIARLYVFQVSVEGRSGLPGSVQHGSTNSATRSGDIESILRVSIYKY